MRTKIQVTQSEAFMDILHLHIVWWNILTQVFFFVGVGSLWSTHTIKNEKDSIHYS